MLRRKPHQHIARVPNTPEALLLTGEIALSHAA
jgi:hypothetical protein